MKKKIKKALILPLAIVSLFIASCSKDNAVQQDTQEKAQIETLRQFLAEKLQLDPADVVYDEQHQKFRVSKEYDFGYSFDDVYEVYKRDKGQEKN